MYVTRGGSSAGELDVIDEMKRLDRNDPSTSEGVNVATR